MDSREIHVWVRRVWTERAAVPRVIHIWRRKKAGIGQKMPKAESFPRFHRYPQLTAEIRREVLHGCPQCGKVSISCGQAPLLPTCLLDGHSRDVLSRRCARDIHGLSTAMWTGPIARPQASQRALQRSVRTAICLHRSNERSTPPRLPIRRGDF